MAENTLKADILKRIRSISQRGAKLDTLIHSTAVDCLAHAREHGDITLLSKLAEAMPKSSRRKALIHWAKTYAPVNYSEKNEKFTLRKGRGEDDWKLGEAESVPFWDLTAEKQPAKYDLQKVINSVSRGIINARKQGNIDVSTESAEDQIREAVRQAMNEPVEVEAAAQ